MAKTARKTTKKKADQPVQEILDAVEESRQPEKEKPAKKEKKAISLKQYMVSGAKDPERPRDDSVAVLVLDTCALNARKGLEARFPGMKVVMCMQTADTSLTKEDLQKRDFWDEGLNWVLSRQEGKAPEAQESAGRKKYFEMKRKAEVVQAAKRKLGITDWETAGEEKIATLDSVVAKIEAEQKKEQAS